MIVTQTSCAFPTYAPFPRSGYSMSLQSLSRRLFRHFYLLLRSSASYMYLLLYFLNHYRKDSY